MFLSRLILFFVSKISRHGTRDRAESLIHLIRNALIVGVFVGGLLITLSFAGVAIGPLLGSAAVVGLAVAFATQNLIRDYFHGIIMMLENQYTLRDNVTINNMSGVVEAITLRLTVLRDFEGNRHFIPNGKINTVTNQSHTWSRAVVEVQIGRDENPNKMTTMLENIAKDLRTDERFRDDVLDDPEMIGVANTGDTNMTLKFGIKTRPNRKQAVKCELMYRIKKKFEEINYQPGGAGAEAAEEKTPVGAAGS